MNPNLIKVGGVYHDNKLGVREVLSLEERPTQVRYRVLAAKAEQSYCYKDKPAVSILGATSICGLDSFARWAKVEVPADAVAAQLAQLAASRLKLSPGEKAFMTAVAKGLAAAGRAPDEGAVAPVDQKDARSAIRVESKGLVSLTLTRAPGTGGTLALTLLGASWIRAQPLPT